MENCTYWSWYIVFAITVRAFVRFFHVVDENVEAAVMFSYKNMKMEALKKSDMLRGCEGSFCILCSSYFVDFFIVYNGSYRATATFSVLQSCPFNQLPTHPTSTQMSTVGTRSKKTFSASTPKQVQQQQQPYKEPFT